jgi:hypothetical protein
MIGNPTYNKPEKDILRPTQLKPINEAQLRSGREPLVKTAMTLKTEDLTIVLSLNWPPIREPSNPLNFNDTMHRPPLKAVPVSDRLGLGKIRSHSNKVFPGPVWVQSPPRPAWGDDSTRLKSESLTSLQLLDQARLQCRSNLIQSTTQIATMTTHGKHKQPSSRIYKSITRKSKSIRQVRQSLFRCPADGIQVAIKKLKRELKGKGRAAKRVRRDEEGEALGRAGDGKRSKAEGGLSIDLTEDSD